MDWEHLFKSVRGSGMLLLAGNVSWLIGGYAMTPGVARYGGGGSRNWIEERRAMRGIEEEGD